MLDGVIAFFADGGWVVIPVWYLLLSLVTYCAYASDKSSAVRGEWRISESKLHTFELIGGWPGAAVAQRVLRHKNRKASYQATYLMMIALNLSALVYVGYRLSIAEYPIEWRPSRIAERFVPSVRSLWQAEEPANRSSPFKNSRRPKGPVSICISR